MDSDECAYFLQQQQYGKVDLLDLCRCGFEPNVIQNAYFPRSMHYDKAALVLRALWVAIDAVARGSSTWGRDRRKRLVAFGFVRTEGTVPHWEVWADVPEPYWSAATIGAGPIWRSLVDGELAVRLPPIDGEDDDDDEDGSIGSFEIEDLEASLASGQIDKRRFFYPTPSYQVHLRQARVRLGATEQ